MADNCALDNAFDGPQSFAQAPGTDVRAADILAAMDGPDRSASPKGFVNTMRLSAIRAALEIGLLRDITAVYDEFGAGHE